MFREIIGYKGRTSGARIAPDPTSSRQTPQTITGFVVGTDEQVAVAGSADALERIRGLASKFR